LAKLSRWLLLKNSAPLTAEERQTLQQVLEASPELNACYQLKEEFRQLLDEVQEGKTAAARLAT